MASAAVRVSGAEKAPIAWITGMDGKVVGWVARRKHSKFCMGGGRFPGTPGSGVYGGMTPL